jgi:hypothetical protein
MTDKIQAITGMCNLGDERVDPPADPRSPRMKNEGVEGNTSRPDMRELPELLDDLCRSVQSLGGNASIIAEKAARSAITDLFSEREKEIERLRENYESLTDAHKRERDKSFRITGELIDCSHSLASLRSLLPTPEEAQMNIRIIEDSDYIGGDVEILLAKLRSRSQQGPSK